jgi:NADPH2:quinone reductase
MRSIVYTRTGDPDVLELVDAPMPEPGPGEVRVRIVRSGINPTDWKSRRGSEPGQPVDPPQTPNQDGAGVVDAVGTGVEEALVGLRVWVWEAAYQRPFGTAAEYTVVPARQVVMLPDSASYDLAASLPIPFMTAHRCLTSNETGRRRLGPGALEGRHILVAGGAGAVGNAAIQLAAWSDARVIATVSTPAKAQLAAAAGAHDVIDYRSQDVVAEVRKLAPHGVDTVVEVAAAQNAGIDAAVLGAHGTIAIYADNGGGELTVPIRPLMPPNGRLQFVLVYTAPAVAKEQALDDISAALADGVLRVGESAGLPLTHFDLEQAADAHAAVENGAVGKVLLDVTPG